MSSQAHITRLPRELRDMIYDELLGTKIYIYHDEAGKLKRTDDTPIYLALTLSCHMIHAEMYDYAFRNKIITFKPIRAHKLHCTWPIHFGRQFFERRHDEAELLVMLRHLITDDIQDELFYHHPQFRRLLNHLLRDPSPLPQLGHRCVEAPSLQTHFIRHALRLVLERSPPPDEESLQTLIEISNMDLKPWAVPIHHPASWERKDYDKQMVTCYHTEDDPPRKRYTNYCFSAAAGAIRFLHSMPVEVRSRLRTIIINEDQPSVAHPQSHAQGLIPFCIENPHLRIERRIELLNCVFQCQWYDTRSKLFAELWFPKTNRRSITPDTPDPISSLTSWLVEARVLASRGMPRDSFTLVLEDSSGKELGFAFFRDLKSVACVQLLFELENEALPVVHALTWIEQSQSLRYHYRGISQDVEDIISGKSIVKCNFPTGESWIAEEMAKPCGVSIDGLRAVWKKMRLNKFSKCL